MVNGVMKLNPAFRRQPSFEIPNPIDDGALLDVDELSNVFARYEIPIGFLPIVMKLTEYKLHFIINDSASVDCITHLERSGATSYLAHQQHNSHLTRWEAQQDRMHRLVDILAYIPFKEIKISFLNHRSVFCLDHNGRTPSAFADYAHQEIVKIFGGFNPAGSRPIFKAFQQASSNTIHYIFTDGEPDEPSSEILQFLRRYAHADKVFSFFDFSDSDDES